MKLRVTRLEPDGKLTEGGEELLDGPGNKWIELEAPDEATLMRLRPKLKLHRLAVEDALHLDQRPKLEEYPEHLFLVVHGFTRAGKDICQVELHEMHLFIGDDWVLSAHELSHAAIAAVAARIREDPAGTLGRGPDFVAYLLADRLIDEHFPLLDLVSDALDDLEDDVFTKASPKQIQRMFELRKLLVLLRRVLSPQRDVVGLLSRRGIPRINERTTLYFRDVADHLFRLYEQLDSAREMLGSVKDVYLSALAQRTNDITKQLTLFSALFLPLSFIVGFFGQNFDVLGRPIYFQGMLASMVVVPVALFFWFRHKHWF